MTHNALHLQNQRGEAAIKLSLERREMDKAKVDYAIAKRRHANGEAHQRAAMAQALARYEQAKRLGWALHATLEAIKQHQSGDHESV